MIIERPELSFVLDANKMRGNREKMKHLVKTSSLTQKIVTSEDAFYREARDIWNTA